MTASDVISEDLVEGDEITLDDGRRVQLRTPPRGSRGGGPLSVTLWEVGTDNPDFTYTLDRGRVWSADDGF